MPRVSEEHLERRRRQILDAARVCFVRNGFHETSMQDIFAESGLSAGAVYRYFKSKSDIVEAIAADTIGMLGAPMQAVVQEDPLPDLDDVVERLSATLLELETAGKDGTNLLRIVPQAWALALHDPQIAEVVGHAMNGIRGLWLAYAERMREVGRIPADADVEAVAKSLFGLLPGFVLQRLVLGDVDPATMHEGLRTLMKSFS